MERPGQRTIRLGVPGVQRDLRTAPGVFAASGVDRGTLALLRHVPAPEPYTGVLDLGTGYGPIAITAAARQPHSGVWAVDVNRRALDLARSNASDLDNIVTAEPDDVPSALRVDMLYSNPPIKIGKEPLHQLLLTWLPRLAPECPGWLVVKRSMGADSLHAWLNAHGYETRRSASKQGYRILRVDTPGRRPPPPTQEDMATVATQTGRPWTVLGRLAGGWSNSVHLVRRGQVRATLKIKTGTWWREQLDRLVLVVQELRVRGYPTPEIISAGSITDDRSYLLTTWMPGRTAGTTDHGASRRRSRRSRPASRRPATRGTRLVGDDHALPQRRIGEFTFHPSLLDHTQGAKRLVPTPVPALPTGDFVHGDFTLTNTLFDGPRLSAVVDIEAFGRGTVAIDHLALLASLPDPHARRHLWDHAERTAGRDVVVTCLAHRILAILAWASEYNQLLPTARQTAEELLELADG